MKIQKRIVMILSVLMFAFLIVACDDTKTSLTSIEFEGLEDVTDIEFNVDFNIFDGVKALGDDGKDYTEKIKFTTTSTAIAANGDLDTSSPGTHLVRYEIEVEQVRLQQWRNLIVKSPERTDDALIQNGDFAQGTSYWLADQGTIDLSVEAGELKAELTAGANAHEPRLYQMDIPFEEGKSYKISFEGKATPDKVINLQAGELLTNAPWFTDFKPRQVETAALTEEWEEFSYTFRHTLENDRGGILFEFGTVLGQTIDGTVWLRNIVATEVEDEADTVAPEFENVNNASFTLGTVFNPLAGVTAFDLFDGDVTDQITFEIKDVDDLVVDEIDVNVIGTYTITYTVSDVAGNTNTAVRVVSFEEMKFRDENLIVNGEFIGELGEQWGSHTDGGGAFTEAIVDEQLVLDITALGANPWDVQYFYEGFTLELGKTYRVSFRAKASLERDVNLAVGVALMTDPWFTDYLPKQEGITLGTEFETYSFIFTVGEATTDLGKLVLELGNTTDGEVGVITIDNIMLHEKDEEVLITPDFTDERHVVEQADEVIHAIEERTEDALTIDVVTTGGDAYIPHYFYLLPELEAGTYVYKINITSTVTRHLRLNILVPDWGYTSLLPLVDPENLESDQFVDFEVIAGETYEFEVEFTVENPVTDEIKIELDFGPLGFEEEVLIGQFILSDVLMYRK